MSKKVFIVGEVLFLLFIVICIGLIYIVHKYFGKYEFYFLGIVYTVISFLMSFKYLLSPLQSSSIMFSISSQISSKVS